MSTESILLTVLVALLSVLGASIRHHAVGMKKAWSDLSAEIKAMSAEQGAQRVDHEVLEAHFKDHLREHERTGRGSK